MMLENIEPTVLPERQISSVALEELCRQNECGEVERRIALTVGYMRERLNQALRVPKLAQMVGVSQSHFFAVFKKQTGFAPMDLFTRMRMERACELLDSTPLNIKEIAAALGYDDQFYFSRVFKSVKQISPSEYRAFSTKQKTIRQKSFCLPNFLPRAESYIEPTAHSAI